MAGFLLPEGEGRDVKAKGTFEGKSKA